MKKIIYIFLLALVVISCEDETYGVEPYIVETVEAETETPTYSAGTADFSSFVAVGNSLTAGYSDGALFIEGQENSFPNILAEQFANAGGGTFTQPMTDDNLGGLLNNGSQIYDNRMILSFASGSPTPTVLSGTPTTDITNFATTTFNNMGVPGAKSFHLGAANYGNIAGVSAGAANAYFVRMASSPSTSVIADAMAKSPTFFSLWIGNNDILSFATSGGSGVDQLGNLNPATYGGNDITDPTVFYGVYNQLLATLTSGDAKGIVTNIPAVTSLPYFTTVPYNAIPLDAGTAAQLNAAYAPYNAGIVQAFANLVYNTPMTQPEADAEIVKRTITFSEGQNAVVLFDEDLTDLTGIYAALTNMRQATAEDLVVLPALSFLGTLVGGNPTLINGVSVPLADNWILTPEEQDMVEDARDAYNSTIEGLAAIYGLAHFDASAKLVELNATGITLDGISSTSVYATGGGFSLDGVHPSPRGYAIIANFMLDEIFTTYGSVLPRPDVGDYKGLYIN